MAKSKVDYIIDLVREARRERTSPAGDKRTARALVELGLFGTDLLQAGTYMELWKSNGESYHLTGMSWHEAQLMADRKAGRTGTRRSRARGL